MEEHGAPQAAGHERERVDERRVRGVEREQEPGEAEQDHQHADAALRPPPQRRGPCRRSSSRPSGPKTAHTTLASRWSLDSSSAITTAPATSAAAITAPVRAGLIRGCSSDASTFPYDWTRRHMSSAATIPTPAAGRVKRSSVTGRSRPARNRFARTSRRPRPRQHCVARAPGASGRSQAREHHASSRPSAAAPQRPSGRVRAADRARHDAGRRRSRGRWRRAHGAPRARRSADVDFVEAAAYDDSEHGRKATYTSSSVTASCPTSRNSV